MDTEELKSFDFSREINLIDKASNDLRESLINHWIIAEASSQDGTFSKYTRCHYVNLPSEGRQEERATGANEEVLFNHFGGLVTVVFDIFNTEFERSHKRRAESINELVGFMLYFHNCYVQNVQPDLNNL